MKQNPTNSIKAGDRVELRAKNHIKITSDNLMLSEVMLIWFSRVLYYTLFSPTASAFILHWH